MTNYKPAETFPPGEFLKDELEARGWSQADLAEILGRPPRLVSEIISGKRSITPETAQGLGEAFDVSPQYWLNLESAWQLWQSRQADTGVAKRAKIFEKAPIKEMVRRNWITSTSDADQLEDQVLEFFGITSLDVDPTFAHAARKSSSYTASITSSQMAWLARSRRLAEYAPAKVAFSETGVDSLREELRRLLIAPEEARHAAKVLGDHGVRLVINEALAGTRIDGACFWLDPLSPVIALSLRFDRIDAFWFTLFHELAHIAAGDGKEAILDADLLGEGAQTRESKPLFERKADDFATDALIRKAKLDSFITRIKPLFSKEKIRAFAKANYLHPGIVVGQLQFRGEISWAHNREMLAKVRDFVIRSTMTDGWGHAPVLS